MLDNIIRLTYYNPPDASIAVIDGFEIDWVRGFGLREAGQPGAVTETTCFQAGSIGKAVFALGVMRLAAAPDATLAPLAFRRLD